MAFLFKCMADETLEPSNRIDCAKALLPYQHRKMPVATEIDLIGADSLYSKLMAVYGNKS